MHNIASIPPSRLGEQRRLDYDFLAYSLFLRSLIFWPQLFDNARDFAHTISPVDDAAKFHVAAQVGVFYEDPQPYENYHVGVSYSLIFGVSLNEYTASNDGVLIPYVPSRHALYQNLDVADDAC